MTGSGANLELLRIPVAAVATNHGLTSWKEEGMGWMDGWMEEEKEGERRKGETE